MKPVLTTMPIGLGDELLVTADRELTLGDLAELERAVQELRAAAKRVGCVRSLEIRPRPEFRRHEAVVGELAEGVQPCR